LTPGQKKPTLASAFFMGHAAGAHDRSEYNGGVSIVEDATMENMNSLKKAGVAADGKSSASAIVPAAPEADGTLAKKRKRLAKAFSRPLDKSLRGTRLVREKFSLPADEFAKLAALKQRLSEQGLAVKKNELLRAGLMLLAALDDGDLKEIVATVPAAG
jgi:hypothetical protein